MTVVAIGSVYCVRLQPPYSYIHSSSNMMYLIISLQEGDDGDAIAAIEFSNNGYHIAVAHHSGVVRALDLRKQKAIATLNESGELKAVTSVAYDPSGKYLAYGGTGSIAITTVKEWGSTATIAVHKSASSLVWGGKSGLIACSDKERQVRFFGAK
jgi:pre-mRNA-processing factor 19